MDDYIVLSTKSEEVNSVLSILYNSLKPFGGSVNPLKTKVNYDAEVEVEGSKLSLSPCRSEDLSWCGFLIDDRTLALGPDNRRLLSERPLQHSFVTYSKSPGRSLRKCIKNFIRMKCHALILDARLNPADAVRKSVMSIFLVAAMRTVCYVRRLRMLSSGGPSIGEGSESCKSKKGINLDFIYRSVVEGIRFGCRLLRSRTRNCNNRRQAIERDIDGLFCSGFSNTTGGEQPKTDHGTCPLPFAEVIIIFDTLSFSHLF